MKSRFYIDWNQFQLYDVVKERTWDELCIAIYMKFHPIIGNGDLGPASIFFNINQTTLANWISKKDFQFKWYPIIKDWKYVDFWKYMTKLTIEKLKIQFSNSWY